MRHTGPLTGKEVEFPQAEELVSSTDTKGVITFVNGTFCKISGYSEEELVGQAHNIVRHPDMPSDAFALMWGSLKSQKPWLGVVKNRCKNGDHYWVNAYVMPLIENGDIKGYESVRIAPSSEQKERASNTYDRLNSGAKAIPSGLKLWQKLQSWLVILSLTAVIPCSAALLNNASPLAFIGGLALSLITGIAITTFVFSRLKAIHSEALSIINDPIATYIFTGRTDIIGDILFTLQAQKHHLKTALGRFHLSALQIKSNALTAEVLTGGVSNNISSQQQQIQGVTETVVRLNNTINCVAENMTQISGSTSSSVSELQNCDQVLIETKSVIDNLSGNINKLAQEIVQLKTDGDKINAVLEVIRSVAEQTNLLALNAAIEAARAGEQGRGFAVVADEVRSLAQRTQESTQDIQKIIEGLKNNTDAASLSMDSCQEITQTSISQISTVSATLSNVQAGFDQIDRDTQQAASATTELSSAAKSVEDNIKEISDLSQTTTAYTLDMVKSSQSLTALSKQQFDMVNRFR